MKCIMLRCLNQVEVLDKSHCSLENVPNLSRSLEELFLGANKLTTLTRPLFRLTNLRKLNVGDNIIQEIPPDIANLVHLVELDFSRNKIVQIPEQIKFLRSLETCDFSANNIEQLPAGMVQLKNLTTLNLSYCLLTKLPDDFGLLKKLESLELRENELKALPRSFTSLENLIKLDLGQNLIDELPQDIGKLSKLEYLLVDMNNLQTLPDEIGLLKNLQLLDVTKQIDNTLTALTEKISGLKNLSNLHVSNNKLEYLPDGIGNLKNLVVLKADNNRLRELNATIGGCSALQELVLTSNELRELPSTIGLLSELRILNVDENILMELNPQIGSLNRLGILSLRDNKLKNLPSELGNLQELRVLDLADNILEYLPWSFTHLKLSALWLSANQAQPLIKLQADETPSGEKILTCFLLPQINDKEEDGSCDVPNPSYDEEHIRTTAVKFVDTVDDNKIEGQFVRHNTPHPKELQARHQKLFEQKTVLFENPEDLPRAKLHRQNTPHYLKNQQIVPLSDDAQQRVENIIKDKKKIIYIEVFRTNPGIGLSIAGGKGTPPFKDDDEGIFVSKVTPGGPTEAAGVKVKDKILAVNDKDFYEGIDHNTAVEIFKKVKSNCNKFTLKVLRDESDEDNAPTKEDTNIQLIDQAVTRQNNSSSDAFVRSYSISDAPNGTINNLRQSLMTTTTKNVVPMRASCRSESLTASFARGLGLSDNLSNKPFIFTTLVRDKQGGLGLGIEGGADSGDCKPGTSNVTITSIEPDSVAARDGKLQPNDRIITINGTDVASLDHERVVALLNSSDRFLRIVVARGESDDPIDVALRSMPARPPLGSWFPSSSYMAHRPSFTGSYRRPTFGSVSSLASGDVSLNIHNMTNSSAAIPGMVPSPQIRSNSVHTRLQGLRSHEPTFLPTQKPAKPPKPKELSAESTSKGPEVLSFSEKKRKFEESSVLKQETDGKRSATPPEIEPRQKKNNDLGPEERAQWRRARLKSLDDDAQMAKAIAESMKHKREG